MGPPPDLMNNVFQQALSGKQPDPKDIEALKQWGTNQAQTYKQAAENFKKLVPPGLFPDGSSGQKPDPKALHAFVASSKDSTTKRDGRDWQVQRGDGLRGSNYERCTQG